MHQFLFRTVAATVLAAAGMAHAEAPAPGGAVTAPAAPATVDEVVVTGTLAVSINSATTHVEVLNRAELDQAPPAGLGDTLANVPGLRSSAFGPGASRPVIRGLSGARVLVLQNGVGMVDASTLSPDHAVASDPGEATRIEVLRGPSTLAYGGSGIGGVVNVIDERIPTSPAAKGVEGRATASYGTVDQNRAFSGGLKIGSGPVVFAVDATKRRSDDYRVPVPPVSQRLASELGVRPSDDDKVLNSDVDVEGYGAGVSYVHDDGFVGVSVRRSGTDYGVPFPQIAPADPDAEALSASTCARPATTSAPSRRSTWGRSRACARRSGTPSTTTRRSAATPARREPSSSPAGPRVGWSSCSATATAGRAPWASRG